MSVDIRVPTMGESVAEATVGRWLKQLGDTVTVGEPVVELETDKVNLEAFADSAGTIEKIAVQTGASVKAGDLLATIASDATVSAEQPAPAPAPKTVPPVPEEPRHADEHRPSATPVAARMAERAGLDVAAMTGSGTSGKVQKADVARALQAPPAAPVASTPTALAVLAPTADREERVRITRRRQTIMVRLKEAQNTAAMLTTFNEVDMSAIIDIRKRRKEQFLEKWGVGLGFMSFFTRASVGALREFPVVNGEIRDGEIVLKHYYDIGIAVATPDGLVVPVVRDADRKTFAQIEREIGALAARARENRLTLDDISGGTFTITNGGVFGSLLSTPILNTPQVGILGMHTIQERPVVRGGEVVARPMMYLALSYDHRLVDGSDAVRFLVRVKEFLEDPEQLLLAG
ncbi:MAG: 2-oxoglutarate dehydrogenase complex dihydrolipoyllysine-residue succinyltransferase [Armatimonadetes bacterium]|nr:2-oxoglutarate dehydrogenase complex dihydrolipoyllysine-residue succinyltransferase [Armatimonadota bacterium]MDE2207393.1 2-oxoglutarate dehydrogenase complex dihydrolipoyllysine-residue succinyltransferase [Armatimonadota bacterium]